jgi:hypothetical protein
MPSKLPPLDVGKLTLPWPPAREQPSPARPDTGTDEPGAWRRRHSAVV